ncbi:SCO family protein [Nocardioides sp.]|uniref:SCO family protein n=1 Tax=Nocardioides sp. TaxID=35761 RepID=UPI0039E6CADD
MPILLALLAGCGGKTVEFTGITHAAYQVPEITLTDTDGAPYSLHDDATKPLTLVFFGYVNCPDYCPMVMSSIASAMTRLDKDDRANVDVVFVTTDPQRDTPQVLRDYLDHYGTDFIGLTGDLDDIVALGKPLAVYVSDGTELPSGGYDLTTHSTIVTAVTPDHISTVLWNMETSSAQYAADIQAILHGKQPEE